MRTRLMTVALAGALGLTGIALVAPGSALAQTAHGTPRLTALKDALTGLVTDGTLTQTQADEVASRLAEQLPRRHRHDGPDRGAGGPGRGAGGLGRVAREQVAKVLGITVDELRAQREAGRTLAQIAQTRGIDKADLIGDLVTAAKDRLAEAVASGKITQQRADAVSADLTARITEQVDRVGRGPGKGAHGRPGHGPRPDGDGPEPESSAGP